MKANKFNLFPSNPDNQTFFCKLPDVKYFRLCGPYSFYHTHCHCSTKATIDDTLINECGCIPIKVYLQKQAVGHIKCTEHSLPTLTLHHRKIVYTFYLFSRK